HDDEAGNEDGGPACVLRRISGRAAESAVEVVGHGRAGGTGEDDHRPVESGMESPSGDLSDDTDDQGDDEDQGTDDVADFEGLGEKVTACLAEGCGENLHHPEEGGDLRQLMG